MNTPREIEFADHSRPILPVNRVAALAADPAAAEKRRKAIRILLMVLAPLIDLLSDDSVEARAAHNVFVLLSKSRLDNLPAAERLLKQLEELLAKLRAVSGTDRL